MQDNYMDFSEEASGGYEVAETGVYELKIDNSELKKSSTGKNYIGLTFVIRDDVEQPYAGVKIWENIWENLVYRDPQKNGKRIKKTDYEAMSQAQKANIISRMEYDDYTIRMLVHAQDVDAEIEDADGHKTPNPNFKAKFESIDEIAQFLNGMCIQAKVVKYNDDKTGNDRNSIEIKTIKRTSVPPVDESAENSDDDDLPF